ncbi:chemoreceptor glutamine deamidase CheD [Sulfuriferula nivalis]|uniref:Probable chemoreceptor glutamine deamidase CheD n=1 Tax=Sulfuriferula nivalis TaxID=2675298 RepID=A0A809SE96_9PROT|nr:chemoreceptor glutamine deamidase CheD [Sulfuriferula nivalis]BBP01227.1 putative chemoreceptor glutamine deamidase CheD 1 [Sulfuriferula nivalis]
MTWDAGEEHFASNVYYDASFHCDAAKLLPGEYYYTQKDMLIVTVLGSCVSACIRDKIRAIGGMNHFMLPDAGMPMNNSASPSMRYGVHAMDILIEKLLQAGAKRENLEAKVFGGGNVLQGFGTMNVGERNAEFVLNYLDAAKIPVASQDLNGAHPRKVYFFPRTGKVLVRKIKELRNATLVERESEYAKRLKLKVAG